MPSFDAFIEMLMLEQSKLLNMGILNSSKSKALVANHGSQGSQDKYSNKKKKKSKSKPQQGKGQSSSPSQGNFSSSSKKGNTPKKGKPTCAYCKKYGHDGN